MAETASRDVIPLRTATKAWFLISLQTFGGPAGQIAVMQRTLVEEKRWIGQQRFLHALNYCMLLPGPEAQQLAIYVGWLLNGRRGGIIAGTLFVLPGMLALLALSAIYVAFGDTTLIIAIFAGLAPAVVAIVAQAVVRVGKRALHHEPPSARGSRTVLGIGLFAWAIPIVAVAVFTGLGSTLTTQGLFFSGAAVVTFGGAYAVLAFVAQRAVEVYGWLSAQDMVRGLALAESTPGPLIMVVQFVAFLGAYAHPGNLDPWVAGVLGALLTTWVTFVPCFLFILLGAPYVERLRHNRAISTALTGITAAVVGVIANLALYFALHTLFATSQLHQAGPLHLTLPNLDSFRPVAAAITAIAFALIFALRWPMPRVLAICAGLGAAAALVGLPLA